MSLRERPRLRRRLKIAALASAVAVLCLPAGALAAPVARVRTDIVNGHPASTIEFPWQAFLVETNPNSWCGGSIINATHVLTAAHCIDLEGTTVSRTPAEVKVAVGVNNISGYLQGKGLPAGTQIDPVSSLRVHPYYERSPVLKDDVAVLTLAKPLAFNSSVRPISLAAAAPRAGTAVTASGYGQELPSPAPGNNSFTNGSFNWTSQTLVSDDNPTCQAAIGANSAVFLCGYSYTSSPCFGDSGGALVAGNPAVQIGVVSYGVGDPACIHQPEAYTNVTAPEIRDFIEGSSAPPVAPRPVTVPQMSDVSTNVDYSPITCNPGTWLGSPSIRYSFETPDGTLAAALQAGPSSTFTPTSAQIGQQISCTAIATNAGGTAVYRSNPLAPIVADTVPPQSGVLEHRCAGRSCSAVVWASDPNSFGAVTIQGSLGYTTTTTHCVRVRHRRRKRCTTRHVRHTIPAAVAADPGASGQADGAPTYRVSVQKMPYGSSKLTITAIDAAGNRGATHVVKFSVRRPKKKRPVHHHPNKKHHAGKPNSKGLPHRH